MAADQNGSGGMASRSIDDVIGDLGRIVERAQDTNSRIGYFAAMYLKVTRAIERAIADDVFDDGERMTRLDVVFADRYINAAAAFDAGRPTTAAWEAAFLDASRWRPIIIQHLLVGMNAHINLDLGIAAVTVAPGANLASLEHDFRKINDILAELVDGFVTDVAEVSPWVGFLSRIGGRTDNALIEFSIEVARVEAWNLASELARIPVEEWGQPIDDRDAWTSSFARRLLNPGLLLNVGLFAVRVRESNDIAKVIDALSA